METHLPGIQIGQLLVEQGILTPFQVERILQVQTTSHRPFGDLAERLFGINPTAVEDAWVEQYVRTVGITDLESCEIDRNCLPLISRRQAWQFHILPLGRENDQLQFATGSSNLVRAVNFSVRALNEPFYFQIAESEQLQHFLMRHYPVPSFIAEYAIRK
jgi:hypothetical protein